MNHQIIYPMAFYVFYMFFLAVLNFKTRVKAIKSGQVPLDHFKAYNGTPPPDRAIVVARHFDNQFQLPILFLITTAMHFALAMVDKHTLILAWAFVASRLLHSFIHLGHNNVRMRAFAYGMGWLIVLLLWAQLLYFVV